jgi:(p)ppGpp synthase/HD superfamily hydrolase
MATLERAIAIAAQAHQGQRDKAGQPYVLHPLRMMMRMETEREMIAAVLHDVVEDTEWTLADLRREGFAEDVLASVDCLTHRENESYADFIARAKSDPVARRAKLADVEDNMDLRRLGEVRQKDLDRLRRYHSAWLDLVSPPTTSAQPADETDG